MSQGRRTAEEVPKELSTVERRETLLFYLLALVGLVVASIFSTNQIERVETQPLPTYTPTIVITPETNRLGCATIPKGITFRYLPNTVIVTDPTGDSLIISGTVYAST